MRISYIFSPIAIAAGAFLWMSASGGVAKIQNKDRTGSPVSDAVCTACHSAGTNFSTVTSVSISDASGIVTEYTPGNSYTVTVDVQSSGAQGHGFQLTGLLDDDSMAGTGTSITSSTQITSLNDRWYFEHSGVASGGVYEMTWVAPASGSGDVTFYGSVMAVSGDGTTNGDEFKSIQEITIPEAIPNSVKETIAVQSLNIYPNPAVNEVYVDVQLGNISTIEVYSITGQLVFRTQANETRYLMDISSFNKGSYILKVQTDESSFTSRFIKR